MKAKLIDHGGCYEIDIEAENMQETLEVIRFGLNKTKDLRSVHTYFSETDASASVVIGKKKQTVFSV